MVPVPSSLLQEILQIHSDKELRSPELERWWEPGLTAQHHDGPEEVLQSPIPVPCGSCGMSPAFDPWACLSVLSSSCFHNPALVNIVGFHANGFIQGLSFLFWECKRSPP